MNIIHALNIWLPISTTLLLIALSVYAWHQRRTPGALPFSIASLSTALWMTGFSMEAAVTGDSAKLFWFKFQVVCLLSSLTAISCLLLEYTWPGRWLSHRNLTLLIIPPFLFLVMTMTNDLHHLLWRGFVIDVSVQTLRSLFLRLFIAYGYGLGVVNMIASIWLFKHSPQHSWPVTLILLGLLQAFVLYFL